MATRSYEVDKIIFSDGTFVNTSGSLFSGTSGWSGWSGISGWSGNSGWSGFSGQSGYSGTQPLTGFLNKNEDSTLAWDDATRKLTIWGTYQFSVQGTNFTKNLASGAPNVYIIPDTSGTHFIYYNISGVLDSTTVWDEESILYENALVSIVNWDPTPSEAIIVQDERHGRVMDWETHAHFHEHLGCQYDGGLALSDFTIGNGSLDSHAEFSVGNGAIDDEQLITTITDGSPQELSPIAYIPILYKSGATATWVKKPADEFPIIWSDGVTFTGANGRLPFNEFTGGAWQLTQIGNNDYVLVHYFATPSIENPIIGIQGEEGYATIVAAREGANEELNNISVAGLPTPEWKAIASVIFKTGSMANDPQAAIQQTDTGENYVDWRSTSLSPTGGEISSHSSLTGLSNPDHPSYAVTVDSVSYTGNLASGDNTVKKCLDKLDALAYAVNDLSDVTITTPASGEVLTYNGAHWKNDTGGGGGGLPSGSFRVSGTTPFFIDADVLYGGNPIAARGNYAVDLCLLRTSQYPVAGGDLSVLLGGSNNRVGDLYGAILGGDSNNIQGTSGFNTILNGAGNNMRSGESGSVILNGESGVLDSGSGNILNGSVNFMSGSIYGFIHGAAHSGWSGVHNTIIGSGHTVSGVNYSTILGYLNSGINYGELVIGASDISGKKNSCQTRIMNLALNCSGDGDLKTFTLAEDTTSIQSYRLPNFTCATVQLDIIGRDSPADGANESYDVWKYELLLTNSGQGTLAIRQAVFSDDYTTPLDYTVGMSGNVLDAMGTSLIFSGSGDQFMILSSGSGSAGETTTYACTLRATEVVNFSGVFTPSSGGSGSGSGSGGSSGSGA